MTSLLGPLLVSTLLAQIHGGTVQGKVTEDQGKPVAGAQVVFHAPAPLESKVDPVTVQATTNAEGLFRLVVPSRPGLSIRRARVWVFHPGLAIASMARLQELPGTMVLHKAVPKTITIEGPDGRPVAGVQISPRLISLALRDTPIAVPDSVAEQRAVTTGPDGKATLDYLPNGALLFAVRVTAESIGTQDFQLIGSRDVDPGTTITLRLKPTTHLSGKVRNRAGEPIANQPVEIWFKGTVRLEANPVRFKNGQLLTSADGSFQTPDNLLVGSPYRIVVRAPGKETILSDWITIGEKPRVLLPMIQRPLRAVSGRVVDRQGKPLAGFEVFQSGDGPERTSTRSTADGRFTLGGFRQGSVFLFARGEGFRFFGRLIKPSDRDITVELTRTTERPAVEMRMLPDMIPLEESRALARRLLEPYLDDIENKSDAAKNRALRLLAMADPIGVLRILQTVPMANPRVKSGIEAELAVALARSDPARAEAVADAIKVPDQRVMALVAVVDTLPDKERDRKLAMLGRAADLTTVDPIAPRRLYDIGEVAERWFELGEKVKAKALFADGLRLANQVPSKTDPLRGNFAARLARIDLPAALAIAREFPASGRYSADGILRNIAFHLAADNPALAEGVLRELHPENGQDWHPPAVAWKMASADPARARRLVEESQHHFQHPQMYLFLALGLKPRDPAAAQQAFEAAMHGIDRMMNEDVEYYSSMFATRQIVLPLAEQIDPALVPEYFWRIVAARPSPGNPRPSSETSEGLLVFLLAWYDRAVAAALFEPVRARIDRADDRELARSDVDFQAWSTLDPRAAVARLEQVQVDPMFDLNADRARRQVAETLGLAREQRWRTIWGNFTELGAMFERDLR